MTQKCKCENVNLLLAEQDLICADALKLPQTADIYDVLFIVN